MTNLQKESRLTFIEQTVFGSRAKAKYLCACGNIKEISISNVKRGHTVSCGCYNQELKRKRAKHGMFSHTLYYVWQGIKRRCYNPNTKDWPLYGGRGVIMCDEWKSEYMNFYNWAICNGWKKGLYLDKDIKAKELGVEALLYSPDRCRFITPKESSNNVRTNRVIEYNGVNKNLSQWAEEFGIKRETLKERLNIGWSIHDALTKPIKNKHASCR